jgi:hypothetical protein
VSKIINITDKLSLEKPQIQIGEKLYTVDDSMDVVFKFEELAVTSTKESLTEALTLAIGQEAMTELNIGSTSVNNFKVYATAILAAMQGIEYDDAAARFRKATKQL